MIRKNKGFISVLIIFILVFGVLINKIEVKNKEKQLEKSLLNRDKPSQNSVVIQQNKVDESQKLSGILVNVANEPTHIELNWDFSVLNVLKSDLIVNGKNIQNIPLTTKKLKLNVVENHLSPENNEITLLLTTDEKKQIPTTISVSVGYVYDMYYSVSKINSDTILEFSYLTNAKSPVSLPKLKESGVLSLNLLESPTYTDLGEYKKTTLKYNVDISKLEQGNHRVVLLWDIESINHEFSQILDISK